MAAENFKVKKGLEVGTAITATSSGVNVTGIVTATQFVGDGSGLTGVTGSGSGVVVKDEGSAVGTAGTINFVGSGVAATLSQGTATVTVNAGGLDNVVEDLTPQLGGNLDLNGKFVNGTGGANITGVVTATTLKGNGDFVDIDVDGTAELDNVNIAGVTTMTGNLTLSSPFPKIIITDTNNDSDYEIANANGLFRFKDITNSTDRLTIASNGTVNVNNDLNVDGRADLDDVVVAGVSTFSSNIDANGNIDVSGRADLDDLVVSGVGTFSTRIDTNGVELGTNTTTFAAKFADNAVANFGTDNDLKISHDNSNALIRNSKGKMVVVGVVSATSGAVVTGVVTATTFSGSGASLTNLPSAQLTGALPALDGSALTGVTGSGSGIIVRHDGSVVGTASSINFSTNLDVSAISAGIVTVTASGGSSQNVFSTIAVSGQSNVVADSTTDTLTFAAGSNVTLTTNAGTDTITIAAANDNTQLSSEQVQDIVGAMFSSNTETDITATYQDADGTIDLVVDLSSLNASNLDSGEIPNGRFPATLPAVSGANLTALNASEITSGTLPIARIDDDAVTFAKMQNVGTGVFIGRNDGGTGDIETLTAAEARTLLNVADGATAGITTANTNVTATWSIGGNSGSGYQFTGPGQDGSEGNPDIYLVRGQRYRFVNTTGTGHPFEFRNEANNADYTDGITGSQSGTQEFNVQHDAPAALKYRCTIHQNSMLGNIYIVGQHLANGANNRVLTATSAYGMNGESNLTFDGTNLSVTGAANVAGTLIFQPGGTAWSTTNTRPQLGRQADGELRLGAGSDSSSIVTFYTSPSAGGTLAERFKIQSTGIRAYASVVDTSYHANPDPFGDGSGIVYYRLNDNFHDSGMFAKHGTSSQGGDPTFGFQNSSGERCWTNPADGAISIPNLKNSYPFTMAAWVNISTWPTSSNNDVIMNLDIGNQRVTLCIVKWADRNTSDPSIMYGGTSHWVFPASSRPTNEWIHLVYSVVASNNSGHAVYQNGSALSAIDKGSNHGGIAGWAIGGNADNGERFAIGRIGSIRFFNKAISSSEASALYTNDKFYT